MDSTQTGSRTQFGQLDVRLAEAQALLMSAFEDDSAEVADIEAAESDRYARELAAFEPEAELDELNAAYLQMQEDAEAANAERDQERIF